ncbi:MAG: TatD family hydrolase [Acidimicrobiia bacterium]|nr:TatD family hydrolase [Acidimicrobiia bacterium]
MAVPVDAPPEVTPKARWVDTHGHLFLLNDDPGVVLDRATDAGVDWLVCPGVDGATAAESERIASRYPDRVRWSAGLHPHEAERWGDESDVITELASRADAVGECGLDYYRNLAPPEAQRVAFTAQVRIADDLDKPIIIHCRDAFSDVYDVLERAGLGARAVLHCWTGGRRWTKRFRDLGVTFSFAGPLTYVTADTLRLGAAEAPPDSTMVETDSPYLTPEPLRGSDNEPANVGLTGRALARVWGMSVEEVASRTTATASRVFDRG